MKPSTELTVYCYVDFDFAGLWSYEDGQDPTCVRIRTRCLIMIGNCPTIWSSKIQTEMALSTIEVEHIALSTALKDRIPFYGFFKVVHIAVVLDDNTLSTIRTIV